MRCSAGQKEVPFCFYTTIFPLEPCTVLRINLSECGTCASETSARQHRFDELRVIRPTKDLQNHLRVHSCHRADVLQTVTSTVEFLDKLSLYFCDVRVECVGGYL
jgi:hypothetical protein